ncbi:DNA ligase D [Labedaea rhizosphaerae]|uniref:DNA ligase (ATP) n=1 Tax=Labedaea rhizosphaerae TaxID=598644 RepID=A0A4R6SIX2_LABRH|nr:DNA ligase D [Labedaea rhizosphaerae]TDQ00948.1 bifunctional non-homologous end joining protein LigD [Labedaea rhizosphaerae]
MADNGGMPAWIKPMLASPDGGTLPVGPRYVYEYKYDGYRAHLGISATGVAQLISRNGNDLTPEFNVLAKGAGKVLAPLLDGTPAVFDGEIVVRDERGRPSFSLLQHRRGGYPGRKLKAHPDAVAGTLEFLLFDLLRLGDRSLLDEPYTTRRDLLERFDVAAPVSLVPAFTHDDLVAAGRTPHDLLAEVAELGYEGLVAKQRDSTYRPGTRTKAWLKHPLISTQEVIICGWRPGQSDSSVRFGGLLLGAHDPDTGELTYLGDVGTGFTERVRRDIFAKLKPLARKKPPFPAKLDADDLRNAHWVQPELVGEVVYRQYTRTERRLRHTSWRGLRPDRDPEEITVPRLDDAPPPPAPEPPQSKVTVQVGDRRLRLSNLEKVLYPADGFTKGEVINYYSRIAPILLPHIADRPVTFIRYPDGVDAEPFFEKNAPSHAPDWLRTVRLPSSGARSGRGPGSVTYPLLDDLPGLVWSANLAALELHVPQWTVTAEPERNPPDRLVFDLDPGPGTTVVDCARVASRLRDALAEDGLTAYAKTSGSKGMQLYCRIATDDPGAPSGYAKALAERLAKETPDQVTAVMAKVQRKDRVFIDWSQNNPHKTTIAAYSLRGRTYPTVSTPVTWEEVEEAEAVEDLTFTAEDVLDRVDEHGDLLEDLLDKDAPPLPG